MTLGLVPGNPNHVNAKLTVEKVKLRSERSGEFVEIGPGRYRLGTEGAG